ncbi:ABC transporter substrate-binding protein [Streptomyces sp. WAC 06738]|uniref:ABC transporter permease n=1 Tax=Streptomyces sp. WAC 06738 TaxID=2203210 RepID=UPI000F70459D|nr:FtsX-like permease family protein [Streptomyces sp. WAC 06738]AZM44716.1 ABC transporter substrate-binding protein [Streptomyces sp. WAC 06738]
MSGTRASLRLSMAGLRTHKRRFAGTFFAVLLGVAFLGGTLVMGDTLRSSFDAMFGRATSGTDAVVRGDDMITTPGESFGTRRTVPTELADEIARMPGVAAAEPRIEGPGQLLGKDGEPVGGGGPPTLAGNWIADEELNSYQIDEGRAPERSGEAVINRGAAKDAGLGVGDTTTVRTPDPLEVTIVGISTFGGEDGMGQTSFTALTRADAEKYLTAEPGRATSIQVRADPGESQAALVEALAPALPDGIEAVTGQEVTEENQDQIAGQFLSGFTAGLLGFAGVAMLVATFSIYNTFAIVVAQRTRDNALLRALGATRRQVVGQTMAEALVVAVLASLVGLAGGVGIAAGLQALFPAVGFPFPDGDLVISGLSLALPFATGVVVCLASALAPAVRAGRTSPLAALRETAVDDAGSSRVRALVGGVLTAAGAVLTVYGAVPGGASSDPSVMLTVLGAVVTLAAFVVLGPVASSYAVRILGAPLRRMNGRLARRNALRSPKRTAATATALMIGVAVVSLFTVFGASLKSTMDQTVSRAFAGDVAVRVPAFGPESGALSPKVAPAVAELPEVEHALGLGSGVARVDGDGRALTVTDPGRMGDVLDLGTVRGSLTDLGTDGVAVSRSEADDHGWQVGSTARFTFTDGEKRPFTVRAVYDQADLAGDYVLTREAWEPHRMQDSDSLVAVAFKAGVAEADGKAAVEKVAERYGNPEVQTRDEFAESSAAGVDMMLTLVYALLALAVLIALLGIANTLTLAVHERTRELGLLRAVGQTRAQLRAMVRWESVLVAAFGTAGGLTLGAFLGWAMTKATDSSGDGVFTVPPLQLAIVALVGLTAGALAAWRPSRRAARLDVLGAIATE